jgi:hypothetical protein
MQYPKKLCPIFIIIERFLGRSLIGNPDIGSNTRHRKQATPFLIAVVDDLQQQLLVVRHGDGVVVLESPAASGGGPPQYSQPAVKYTGGYQVSIDMD